MTGLRLSEIAQAVGGTVVGDGDVVVTGVASVYDAAEGDIVLAENARYLAEAEKSSAAAVIAPECDGGTKPVVVVESPRGAFSKVLELLAPAVKQPEAGVDPGARLGEGVRLGEGAAVGFGSWIGDGVEIGEGAVIYPLVYVGDGVRIGAGTVLYPHVTVYHGCEIGARVTVHSGAVIGADGFGYIRVGNEIKKVPQIGNVVIEDDVEVGANTTIDRAKTGSTRIGRATKIDNLVQVAHNVRTGRMCVLAALAGIAGSTELGDGVTVAGQVGMKDHVRIGDGAVIAARAGVIGDVPAGATFSGFPARPHKEAMRAEALAHRLPEMRRRVDALQKEVDELREQIARLTGGDGSGSSGKL
jgi:UDP-3-O-[3-hydroxymyristoyl] glucosamine N-acyltransferase